MGQRKMWKPAFVGWLTQRAAAWREAALDLRGIHFAAAALWLCVAGALWLQPNAMRRTALEARLEEDERRLAVESALHKRYTEYHLALQNDRSAIENVARSLGYGRAGERVYPLTEQERRAGRALIGRAPVDSSPGLFDSAVQALAPVLMLLIAGVAAVLFFTGLKVEDHLTE